MGFDRRSPPPPPPFGSRDLGVSVGAGRPRLCTVFPRWEHRGPGPWGLGKSRSLPGAECSVLQGCSRGRADGEVPQASALSAGPLGGGPEGCRAQASGIRRAQQAPPAPLPTLPGLGPSIPHLGRAPPLPSPPSGPLHPPVLLPALRRRAPGARPREGTCQEGA